LSFFIFDLLRGILFEWDCELRESHDGAYTWTDHEVEDGAPVVNYGVKMPETWTLEGLVTATPLIPGGIDLQRVIDADGLIRELADKLQPVSFVSGWYVGTGAITRVGSTAGRGDPQQLPITVGFKQIRLVEPETVQIPASRLKPPKRKRVPPAPKGGASTGKAPTPKQRRTALKALLGKR
jgi:hypothetical protein